MKLYVINLMIMMVSKTSIINKIVQVKDVITIVQIIQICSIILMNKLIDNVQKLIVVKTIVHIIEYL